MVPLIHLATMAGRAKAIQSREDENSPSAVVPISQLGTQPAIIVVIENVLGALLPISEDVEAEIEQKAYSFGCISYNEKVN